MTKPASGTALSTGSAFYTGLVRAYGILETSGTTLADSKSGDTATIPGANAGIVANSGDPYLEFTAATDGAAMATGIPLPNIANGTPYSWSLAWGGLITTATVWMGNNAVGNSFVYRSSATDLMVSSPAFPATVTFPGVSGMASYHDYLLTCAWSGSSWTIKLYQDGVLLGTQTASGTAGQSAFILNHIGNGYPSTGLGMTGQLWYVYLWDGTAWSLSDAVALHADPYDVFTAAAPSTTTVDVTSNSVYGHYVQVEGECRLIDHAGGTVSWSSYGGQTASDFPDMAVRFKATCSQIDLHVYKNGCPVRLSVDGVDVASATLANTSAWGDTSGLFTGLDSGAEHEYLISFGNVAYVDKVVVTGTVNTATLAAHPVIVFYGDSITAGLVGTGNDSTLSFAHRVGLALGYQPVNRGIAGTYVTNQGAQSGSVRTGDVTGVGTAFSPASGPVPSVVLVLYGVNDVEGYVDVTTFGPAYSSMLSAIRAGLPSALIVCEAILKANSPTETTQDAFNTKIAQAVAALGDSRIVYKTGGYDAYNPSTGGGLHPNAAGYATIATAFAADILAALSPGGVKRVGMGGGLPGLTGGISG